MEAMRPPRPRGDLRAVHVVGVVAVLAAAHLGVAQRRGRLGAQRHGVELRRAQRAGAVRGHGQPPQRRPGHSHDHARPRQRAPGHAVARCARRVGGAGAGHLDIDWRRGSGPRQARCGRTAYQAEY